MGKGSKQRPTDMAKFNSNYDAIFNKPEEKTMTQAERVLDYLESGKKLTRLNAFNELGIIELSSRICELKSKGHKVNKKMITVKNRYDEKCSVAEYYMEANDAV